MEKDIIIRNQELTAQLVEKSIGAAALFLLYRNERGDCINLKT